MERRGRKDGRKKKKTGRKTIYKKIKTRNGGKRVRDNEGGGR